MRARDKTMQPRAQAQVRRCRLTLLTTFTLFEYSNNANTSKMLSCLQCRHRSVSHKEQEKFLKVLLVRPRKIARIYIAQSWKLKAWNSQWSRQEFMSFPITSTKEMGSSKKKLLGVQCNASQQIQATQNRINNFSQIHFSAPLTRHKSLTSSTSSSWAGKHKHCRRGGPRRAKIIREIIVNENEMKCKKVSTNICHCKAHRGKVTASTAKWIVKK